MSREKAAIGTLALGSALLAALAVDAFLTTPGGSTTTLGEAFGFATGRLSVVVLTVALLAGVTLYRARIE